MLGVVVYILACCWKDGYRRCHWRLGSRSMDPLLRELSRLAVLALFCLLLYTNHEYMRKPPFSILLWAPNTCILRRVKETRTYDQPMHWNRLLADDPCSTSTPMRDSTGRILRYWPRPRLSPFLWTASQHGVLWCYFTREEIEPEVLDSIADTSRHSSFF